MLNVHRKPPGAQLDRLDWDPVQSSEGYNVISCTFLLRWVHLGGGVNKVTQYSYKWMQSDNCGCKAAGVVVKVTPGLILRKMDPERS